jgi:hypothetical protein
LPLAVTVMESDGTPFSPGTIALRRVSLPAYDEEVIHRLTCEAAAAGQCVGARIVGHHLV